MNPLPYSTHHAGSAARGPWNDRLVGRSARARCAGRLRRVWALSAMLLLPCTIGADSPQTTTSSENPLAGDGAELLRRVQTAIAELADRVSPSVVAIQADRSPGGLGRRDEWIPRSWVSTGSGVIIRKDGRILTSQHVIEGAVDIHVVLFDGRRLPARRIAADRRRDLAVIRIDAEDLEPAELADGRGLKRGNLVLALGNPLGLSGDGQSSVSHGLISAIARPLDFGHDEDRYYGDMLSTTAPIHPGNSGGPLFDIDGRVIGIVIAVSTRSDGREGIGFAVPIDSYSTAIIEKLLRGQQIEYGYLGVSVRPVPDGVRRAAGLAEGEGVLLADIESQGPAERAGLRRGDIVLTVDAQAVDSDDHFVRLIGAAGPDQRVELLLLRDGQRRTVPVTLTRRAAGAEQPLPDVATSFRGAAVGEVDPVMRVLSNLPEHALLVLRVDAASPADRAGLAPGDIIARIEGQPISASATSLLASAKGDVLLGLANGATVIVNAE